MKSAFLVADHEALLPHLRDSLIAVAASVAWQSDIGVQVQDQDGRAFTLYDEVEEDLMWEVREGPFKVRFDETPPDMSIVRACYVECGWEGLFADLVGKMAAALDFPLWVLDSNSNLWRANSIDPARLQL